MTPYIFISESMTFEAFVSSDKHTVTYDLFSLDWDQILTKLNEGLYRDLSVLAGDFMYTKPQYFDRLSIHIESSNDPIPQQIKASNDRLLTTVIIYDTRAYNNSYVLTSSLTNTNQTLEEGIRRALFEEIKNPRSSVYSGFKNFISKSYTSKQLERYMSLEDKVRFVARFQNAKTLIELRTYSNYFKMDPSTITTMTNTTTNTITDSTTTTTARDISSTGACKKTRNQVPTIFIDEKYVDYKTKTSSTTRPVASPSCRPEDQPIAVISLAHSPTPPPTNSPTATLTQTPTPTPTITQTPTYTATATATPTQTQSQTATVTPSTTVQTPTPTPTVSQTPFATSTPTGTAAETPLPTQTPTGSPTETPTQTPTHTMTPSPTSTRSCVYGQSYTSLELPISLPWNSIVDSGSVKVLLNEDGTYMIGYSDYDWKPSSISSTYDQPEWKNLDHINNKFIAAGKGAIAVSENAITWNVIYNLPKSENTEYKWNKVLYISELGSKYFAIPTVVNQENQSPAPLAYSIDLNSWQKISLPVVYTSGTENRPRNWLSAAYGNGVFVLGSDSREKHEDPIERYKPAILTSFNGITWNSRSIGNIEYDYEDTFNSLGNVEDIIFNGTEFVALVVGLKEGNSCARIFHSTNGINWTLSKVIDGTRFSMTFGTTNNALGIGKFLIAAENPFNYTTELYYSVDGLWWITIGQVGSYPGINKIKAINDVFYAVDNNYLYTSEDCETLGSM